MSVFMNHQVLGWVIISSEHFCNRVCEFGAEERYEITKGKMSNGLKSWMWKRVLEERSRREGEQSQEQDTGKQHLKDRQRERSWWQKNRIRRKIRREWIESFKKKVSNDLKVRTERGPPGLASWGLCISLEAASCRRGRQKPDCKSLEISKRSRIRTV